jgi:hypothetical protein
MACWVLALRAPAAFRVSIGCLDAARWWLRLLAWMQSTASIVDAYLSLESRTGSEKPSKMGINLLMISSLFTIHFIFS